MIVHPLCCRAKNDAALAAGQSIEYFYRALYCPDKGMFSCIPSSVLPATGTFVEVGAAGCTCHLLPLMLPAANMLPGVISNTFCRSFPLFGSLSLPLCDTGSCYVPVQEAASPVELGLLPNGKPGFIKDGVEYSPGDFIYLHPQVTWPYTQVRRIQGSTGDSSVRLGEVS